MRVRLGIALGLGALAATIMIGPADAGATAATTASGAAVAVGTVTSAQGTAMPGAAVDLYAWPTDAVLQALRPGELVPRTLLATATTNSAGEYTLRVPVATLQAAAVDSGYANLEIDSPVGGFWFFPYQTSSLPADPPAPATVNLTSNASVNCGNDQHGQPYGFFGWTLVAHKHPANAVVGQGYIVPGTRTAGDWVKFDYNQASSHTQASSLGVGLSGYGLSAGYSTSGSKKSTAKRGESWPHEHENAWFLTEFRVDQYRGLCYEVAANTKTPRARQHPAKACPAKWLPPGEVNVPGNYHYVHKCFWLVASPGWFGGATLRHPKQIPAAPAGNCAPQTGGSNFHFDTGKAVNWSSGFTIGAAIGIKGVNLKADFGTNAQTGYDANAKMAFQFHKTGRMCGTNTGPYAAAILVAKGRA
jgi:hypothetical protein